MAGSTYSSNLKIELMSTGENAGTWGNITNTNLGTALEQAVVGLGNPDFVADANLTITLTDTNAAQAARALVLNVTSGFGSLTATRELVVPTSQKQYIVQNNTTGGQSITVKTSGGTGITVPNGRKAHLYVDGTNVVQMFDFVDINGGTIDGTAIGATTASTGAFTTLSATGVTTVQAGTVSAPAITTTGDTNTGIFFPAADTIAFAEGGVEGMRIDSAGNVGIGTSSPGAKLNVQQSATGNFTSLLLSRTTGGIGNEQSIVWQQNDLSNLQGSAIAGSFDSSSTGSLRFKTASSSVLTERMRIDSAGNVGIGTSSPTNALSVTGNANVTGNVTLGDASTDTVTVNGYMGVGGAPATNHGLFVSSSALTGSSQNGVVSQLTATSAATTAVRGYFAGPATAAASFTAADVVGFWSGNAVKGAGSTITNAHGLYIADQTQGTNNFGITSLVSSGTNKWNIYASGTAANYFAGDVSIGNTTAISSAAGRGNLTINGSSSAFVSLAVGATRRAYITTDATNFTLINDVAGATILGTNGSERMRIDSAGNVGIGTSSPTDRLEVAGVAVAGSAAGGTTGSLVLRSRESSDYTRLSIGTLRSTGAVYFGRSVEPSTTVSAGFNGGFTGTAGGGAWVIDDDGSTRYLGLPSGAMTKGSAVTLTERMRIDSAGNVGIGTSAPGVSGLEISRATGSASPTPAELRIATTTNAADWSTTSPWGRLSFYSADSSGSGPKIHAAIDVGAAVSNAAASNLDFAVNVTGSNTLRKTLRFAAGASTTSTIFYAGAEAEAMRIDSAGNVGIGRTSPNGLLHLQTASGNTDLYIQTGDTTSSSRLIFGDSADSNMGSVEYLHTGDALVFKNNNELERMRIDSSGNLLVGTTSLPSSTILGVRIFPGSTAFSSGSFTGLYTHLSFLNGNGTVGTIRTDGSVTQYNTSSDYRLKNTVAPITGALAKVALLKPCTYKWNADGSDGEGFIAHELAEVVPQAVTGEKDAVDAEGKPQYQGIDTSFLVATLTAAIQEQQAIIESLKARLDAANI